MSLERCKSCVGLNTRLHWNHTYHHLAASQCRSLDVCHLLFSSPHSPTAAVDDPTCPFGALLFLPVSLLFASYSVSVSSLSAHCHHHATLSSGDTIHQVSVICGRLAASSKGHANARPLSALFSAFFHLTHLSISSRRHPTLSPIPTARPLPAAGPTLPTPHPLLLLPLLPLRVLSSLRRSSFFCFCNRARRYRIHPRPLLFTRSCAPTRVVVCIT